ncbi:YvrJ family protein [Clostridium oceanicum]|uniref:YvrJ family protein n=1 Tax=Clostridium oceanicum TaxID=1543 RepID=A0ABN1JAA3_9CLOT
MYDGLIKLISNLGFPVAVSVYLLVRIEKKLDDLIKAFNDFSKRS